MSKHDRSITNASNTSGAARGTKRSMNVQQALEWAFGKEKAELELPERSDADDGIGFGFGLEFVLLQRATLGCQIDGGRFKSSSYTHEDAEVIAATVAGMPNSLGGKRMAISVAELARAGLTPDWMPGAAPRCKLEVVADPGPEIKHGSPLSHSGTGASSGGDGWLRTYMWRKWSGSLPLMIRICSSCSLVSASGW